MIHVRDKLMPVFQVLLARVKSSAATASAAAGHIGGTTIRKNKNKRIDKQGRRAQEQDYEDDGNEDMTFRPDSPFPWHAAGVACVCGGVYYKFSNVVAVGIFVPIVNGIFFVGLAIFAFLKLRATSDATSPPSTARGESRRGGRSNGMLRRRRKDGTKQRSTYLFG